MLLLYITIIVCSVSSFKAKPYNHLRLLKELIDEIVAISIFLPNLLNPVEINSIIYDQMFVFLGELVMCIFYIFNNLF